MYRIQLISPLGDTYWLNTDRPVVIDQPLQSYTFENARQIVEDFNKLGSNVIANILPV